MVFDSVIMNSGEHTTLPPGSTQYHWMATYQIVLHVFTDTTDQFGAAMIVDGEFVRPGFFFSNVVKKGRQAALKLYFLCHQPLSKDRNEIRVDFG